MTLSVTVSTTPDDGETLGYVLRPSKGFKLGHDYQLAYPEGPHRPGQPPVSKGETWLIPVGSPERTGWPRATVGKLTAFGQLHRLDDAGIARFASMHGWLRSGTLIGSDPVDMSGAHGPGEPVLGDRVWTWRRESARLADLLALVAAGRTLRRGESQVDRRTALGHFQSALDGSQETLWVGERNKLQGIPQPGQPLQWRVVEDPDGRVHRPALAFFYGDREGVIFLPSPLPVDGAPAWGADLAHAPNRAVAEVALYAAGCAAQTVLREESHGALTLAKGIRVAPTTLLGAMYLIFAADLFERRSAKVCPVCHKQFDPIRSDAVYDTEACRQKAHRKGLTNRRKR